MRVPEKALCDFCSNPLDRNHPWPTITYPLAQHQREALAPAEVPQGLAILGFRSPLDLVPRKVTIECCAACLDGLLPIVKNVVESRVADALEDRRQAGASIGVRGED